MLSACATTDAATGDAGAVQSLSAIEVHSLAGGFLAGRFASGNQDSAAAARFFGEAQRFDPGNTALRRQAMMSSLLVGDYLDAATHAEIVARLEQDDTVAPLVAAIGEMRVGRYEDARKRLEGLPSNAALDIIGPILGAWARAGGGDIDGALATLEKLGNNQGTLPLRLYHTALIAGLGNRTAIAGQAFDALRRTPAGTWVHTLLAEGAFLENSGQKPAARALYEAALKASNNLSIAAALGRLQRGEAPTPIVSTATEGVGEAMYGIASLLAQEGAKEPVLVYLRLATMAKPVFPEAQALLAETFEDLGDTGQAMDLFSAIPDSSELKPMAEVRYAMLLAQTGRQDEAVSLLDQRIGAGRQAIEAMIAKGDILRQAENFPGCADAYGDAIKAIGEPDPRFWSVWFSNGICLERSRRWDEAETELQQALALRPDQPSVLNYLAYSWVEQGRNLKKAEAMLVKAADDRPDDGYIVDSLGWVYFRQGRFEEAVDTLEKAVHLKPGDPTINDHLGDAYWAVGRKLEAEFQWRTALALKPDAELKPQIEAKLEKGLPPEKLKPGVD